jgi:hypothetical protein
MLGIARPSECPVCGWTRLHQQPHPELALYASPACPHRFAGSAGRRRVKVLFKPQKRLADAGLRRETHGTCQASPHFPLKGKRGVLDRWMIGGKRSVFCNLFFGLSMMRRSARAPAIASPLVDGNAGLPCHTTRESGVNALPPRPIHATLSLPATGKPKGEGREPAGYTRG